MASAFKICGGCSSDPAPRQKELQSKETFQREKQKLLDRIEKTVRIMTDRFEATQDYLGRKFNIQDQLEILLGVQDVLPSYELQQKWQDGLDYIKKKNKKGLGYIIEAVLQRFCPVQEKRKPVDSTPSDSDKGGAIAEEPPAPVQAPKPAVLPEEKEDPAKDRIVPESVDPKAPAEDRIDPQIERLCIDPYVFFDEITKRTQGVVFDPCLLNLSFCLCIQQHTVTKDNTVRLNLEDMSIQAFKNTHPDKNAPITIVSIGPGGCFQELVYLAKLARAGYRNIDLKLIDIARPRVQMPLVSLREFCRDHLQGYNINIGLYDLVESYIKEMEKEDNPQNKERFKADLFLLIDINGSLPSDSFSSFARAQLLRAGSSVIAYIDKNQEPFEPYCLVFDGKDRDPHIRANTRFVD